MSRFALETVVLAAGDIELTVLPGRGARLHRLRVDGHDLLRTPADPRSYDDEPFYWGAYVMAPWCNRLAAEPVSVAARTVELPANFRDGTAIHGQVYDRPWQQTDERRFEVSGGGAGWPWSYRVGLELQLAEGGLVIDQWLANEDDVPMPAGLGLHPWFRRPLELAIHAQRVHRSVGATAGGPEPVAGEHDLRRLGPPAADLDATWTDLTQPAAELRWPTLGLYASLSGNDALTHVTAASPSEVDGTAVEPQTHAPHGLRRLLDNQPGGLEYLAPGTRLHLRTAINFSQASGESRT